MRAPAWTLRLPRGWPEPREDLLWWWRAPDGRVEHGRAATSRDLPAYPRDADTLVWTPAAASVLTRVSLPTRTRAKLMQALPFALEELLLDDLERLHYAVAPLSGREFAAVVTARNELDAWLAGLRAAGFSPAALCPVTLATPAAEGSWALAWDGEEAWLRTGMLSGVACSGADGFSASLVEALLREARDRAAAPAKLVLHRPPAELDAAALQSRLGLLVEVAEGEPPVLLPSAEAPINLLQGAFARGPGRLRAAAAALRPAAALLACGLLATTAADFLQWRALAGAERAQQRDMAALLHDSFPEVKTLIDAPLQMERGLAQLREKHGAGEPGDLLRLLGAIAPALSAQPGLSLDKLQYAAGGIQVELRAADRQRVDAAVSALVARGFSVQVLAMEARGGAVEARARIRMQGVRS